MCIRDSQYGDAGMLVQPGDAAALADALRGLLTEPQRARELSAAALKRATAEYTVDRMMQRYLGLYAMLTKGLAATGLADPAGEAAQVTGG